MKPLLIVDEKEINAVRVSLHAYLETFSDKTIKECHPESGLAYTIKAYNRCKNLLYGNYAEYDLNRKPFHRIGREEA